LDLLQHEIREDAEDLQGDAVADFVDRFEKARIPEPVVVVQRVDLA